MLMIIKRVLLVILVMKVFMKENFRYYNVKGINDEFINEKFVRLFKVYFMLV